MILFIIAYILLLPLTIINFFFVKKKKGYFRNTALNIDKFANREFRALWNVTLQKGGYKFGKENDTISFVLGTNLMIHKLTKIGKILVLILTKKHCIDAVLNNKNYE